MTRNLKLFVGAVIIFYLIGAVNDSLAMYVLAAGALAVVLACFFLTRLVIRGVVPQVQLGALRTHAGWTMPALAWVSNSGAITRTGMSLRLEVTNETVPQAGQSLQVELPALPPRSRTEIELALHCPARGRHRIGGVEMVATDPLGMYHRVRRFDSGLMFLSLPRTYEVSGVAGWELLSAEGRRAARALRRAGGDFEGIRRHVPGDDWRHVHWKVTAHTGELVVRSYRQRREAEVTVWLDLWERNHPPAGPEGPTEVAVSVAATLLTIFARGDYLVALSGQGLSPDLSLPSRGEAYCDRALVALAQARPVSGLSFGEFCEERLRHGARLANLFVITPAAEPGLEEVLSRSRHRGAHVVVFLVGGGTGEEGDRLSEAAHAALASRLRQAGMAVLQVARFTDIPTALGALAAVADAEAVAS